MHFGNQKITISPRFFIIIGVIIVAIIIGLQFKSKPKVNNYLAPAFAASQLTTLKPGFLQPYIRNYGLIQLSSPADLLAGYNQSIGLPFRFKAYIPEIATAQGARPDLFINGNNWDFSPASFIDPNQTYTEDDLESQAGTDLSQQPLELGFQKDDAPVPGYAYEFTGLLWWRSDQLDPSMTASSFAPSPVLLIDSWERLSDEELEAPTTDQADLNLVYQEGPLEIDFERMEWSSGREMRVCLSIQNLSQNSVSNWNGLSNITADYGQGVESSTALSDALQTATLAPGETIPGYVTFGSDESDPQQNYIFRMPGIDASSGTSADTLEINVPGLSSGSQSEIHPIGEEDTLDHSCTSDTQSDSSTGTVQSPSASDITP